MTAAVAQPEPPHPPVALVGFMGAGKSAVGRALAGILGLPFVDTDVLVASQEGPIADIFERRGEAAFRVVERDVTVAAVARALEDPVVLALGGGSVLSDGVRASLRDLPDVVWLTASPHVLWERVSRAGPETRPLARDEAGFMRLLERRVGLYDGVSTLVVENDGSRAPEAIAAEIAVLVAVRRAAGGQIAGGEGGRG